MPSIYRYGTIKWSIKLSIHYVSMFIHATFVIPRLLFAIRTDKSMAAKFGNGTIGVLLVHDSRVMYCIFVARKELNWQRRKGIELATKGSLLEATINYDTSDFSDHQCICQARLLAIHAAWERLVATAALWMSFLRICIKVRRPGTC